MISDRAALELLCARHGLLTSYFDIWGHRHDADSDSLVELLHELGVDQETYTSDDPGVADSADGRRLAPVAVARAAVAGWTVTAGVRFIGQTIAWTLVLEDGARRHGEGRITHGEHDDAALLIAESLPPGYHRLLVEDTSESTLVIAAPETCFRPAALEGDERVWGPSLQLYALRSRRNWGIGDFGDLLTVIDQWSARGASLVGLNPLHALFTHNPQHISPYSPSSRLQLNTLYIDVDAVDDLAECEGASSLVASAEVQNELAILRASEQVRHADVAALKLRVLRPLHRHFATTHRDSDSSARGQRYRSFIADRGVALRQHAMFEALQESLHAADPEVWGWPVWPERFRSPDAPAVAEFAEAHSEEVDFFCYLQWVADGQLAKAQRLAVERGMPLGLYLDLAVSVDRAGSDAWTHADEYAPGATVGAPPDEVNPNGQGWGLPPLRPDRMRESGHAFFIATLRAVMRHSGALRIDHVMGLMRLFWIAPGRSPTTGAYVLYPLAELIAIVALESQRHRCLIIGEDLGTVPDEIRAAMAQYQLLSYRVLYFERSADGSFKSGADYPRRSLVAVSTHDLPTLAGWWTGHDLAVRQGLGLFPAGSIHEQQLADRAQERVRLLLALERAGLLPEGLEPRLDAAPHMTPALAEAVHAFAASSAAEVMLVQLEDILGMEDQANLPGTVDQHPNWRQRLPLGLEAQATDPRFDSLASRLAALRPRSPSNQEAHRTIVPRATYRLQFHAGFGFDDAIRVLPYLQSLGVSHVYCSPILRARRGSTHGYDVVAHDQINPELGGEAGFARFSAALGGHGMGQLLDMVPNHMGVLGSDNAWWNDVLENGMSSPFSGHFDIDWHPVNAELDGKVLLPVLGQQYGDVLAGDELVLAWEPGPAGFALRYHEHRFPLDPISYASIIGKAAALLGVADEASQLQSLATAFGKLPPSRVAADSAGAIERRRDIPLFKLQLTRLGERPAVETALRAAIAVINAATDKNELHALHEQQSYRLAFWRVAADEINYRRFFDINELAGLRMEDPRVFEATQGFSLDLAAAGTIDGLRIDHPDGLLDPAEYFARLQDGFAKRRRLVASDASEVERPLYVVAEKIAASHEDVPDGWRIHGTTGYRFAMVVNGVLVDTRSEADFDSIWADISGDRRSFADLTYQGKRAVADTALASELTVLATTLLRIAKSNRRTRDYTFNSLRSSLAEIAACMPVYRTYVVDQPSAQDERYIDWAISHAKRHSPLADLSIFDFIRACLRNQPPTESTPLQAAAILQFAHRFQQFSSPVAAKGVEDTAFYRYHRLVSLNEVGGDPATFGLTVRAFHAANSDRRAHWPDTIIATSTHDNKRSEDVRCRIDVLSEIPGVWRSSLDRWRKLIATLRQGDAPVVAPADEYLMYQVLLGTLPASGLDEDGLPAYRERIATYLVKAIREGKERSSWTRPDADYETALGSLVNSALARVRPNPLLTDVQALATEIAWFGALNSASMVLLKYTVPGVPDLYQGNELLDLSLVDPDNRRPVDYGSRERALDHLRAVARSPDLVGQLRASGTDWLTDGRMKLWITWRLLGVRAAQPEFFRQAAYAPLTATGSHADHVVAFARTSTDSAVVVVAGRLFSRLLERRMELPLGIAWDDTAVEGLPDGYLTAENVLTGETHALNGKALRLSDLLSVLPAAALLLHR